MTNSLQLRRCKTLCIPYAISIKKCVLKSLDFFICTKIHICFNKDVLWIIWQQRNLLNGTWRCAAHAKKYKQFMRRTLRCIFLSLSTQVFLMFWHHQKSEKIKFKWWDPEDIEFAEAKFSSDKHSILQKNVWLTMKLRKRHDSSHSLILNQTNYRNHSANEQAFIYSKLNISF